LSETNTTLQNEANMSDEDLLTRSFIYKFLSFAYRYPEDGIKKCLQELWADTEITISVFPELHTIFKLLEEKFADGLQEKLEDEYIVLFGHTAQGTCPPFEIEYGESDEGLQKPHELSDIASFYSVAGLKNSVNSHDREDFISTELEFMNYLYFKQVYANEKNDLKLVESAVELQKKFLKYHLGRWTPAFCSIVEQHSQGGFYGTLAKLTRRFVVMCCEELGVAFGSEKLRIRTPIEKPEDCQNCSFSDN